MKIIWEWYITKQDIKFLSHFIRSKSKKEFLIKHIEKQKEIWLSLFQFCFIKDIWISSIQWSEFIWVPYVLSLYDKEIESKKWLFNTLWNFWESLTLSYSYSNEEQRLFLLFYWLYRLRWLVDKIKWNNKLYDTSYQWNTYFDFVNSLYKIDNYDFVFLWIPNNSKLKFLKRYFLSLWKNIFYIDNWLPILPSYYNLNAIWVIDANIWNFQWELDKMIKEQRIFLLK